MAMKLSIDRIYCRYSVYYTTPTIPIELLEHAFEDRYIIIQKEGLSDYRNYKCTRFSMLLMTKGTINEDKQRHKKLEELLAKLIRENEIEDFIRG